MIVGLGGTRVVGVVVGGGDGVAVAAIDSITDPGVSSISAAHAVNDNTIIINGNISQILFFIIVNYPFADSEIAGNTIILPMFLDPAIKKLPSSGSFYGPSWIRTSDQAVMSRLL